MVRSAKPLRTGLHLFEERETKLEALRHALIEGEQSGASDYSLQGILDELEGGDQSAGSPALSNR